MRLQTELLECADAVEVSYESVCGWAHLMRTGASGILARRRVDFAKEQRPVGVERRGRGAVAGVAHGRRPRLRGQLVILSR